MKDNERNSEYGLNFFESFVSAFNLVDTETFDLGFMILTAGLCHWSMIIKNCANKRRALIITFYDLKINFFLGGVDTG
ncbi:MAG TPA: hypothetical protein VFZ33_17950 [Chitinophagaceae bacterium]